MAARRQLAGVFALLCHPVSFVHRLNVRLFFALNKLPSPLDTSLRCNEFLMYDRTQQASFLAKRPRSTLGRAEERKGDVWVLERERLEKTARPCITSTSGRDIGERGSSWFKNERRKPP
jgi:hypothetical protein